MIRTVIIEDEPRSRQMLYEMLTKQFANITVLAVCENAEEGKLAIEDFQPDLVFSDIELKESSAFEMLQQLEAINFEIIFTTAYEKYAVRAIKFSALDYLLKPFGLDEVTNAVNQYQTKQYKKQSTHQFDVLFQHLKGIQKGSKKIALPTTNGLLIISLNEIIQCQADVNYTLFFTVDKKKVVVTKTLKEFEELLEDYDFIRVHNSHLINLTHVEKYIRGEGGIAVMSDGSKVDISRRRKDEFLKRLKEM